MLKRGPILSPDGSALRCPVPACDLSEQVHPIAVLVDRGGDVVKVTAEGLETMTLPPTQARGVMIDVRCACEAGHGWTIRLRFHKGSTFVETTELLSYPESPQGWPDIPDTIWRN